MGGSDCQTGMTVPLSILLVPALNVHGGRLPLNLAYGLFSLQAAAAGWGGGVDVLSFAPFFGDKGRFRDSEEMVEAVVSLIDTERYGIVGFSTMCSSFHHSLSAACLLAQRSPQTRVWMGGPHASIAPRALLEARPEIEAVFVGETEATLAAVLARRGRQEDLPLVGIAGVCIRDQPYVARESLAALDSLPYVDEAPGFADALATSWAAGLDHELPVEAERGCPGRCAFCSTTRFWGGRVRRKSNTRVISEMHKLHAATGSSSFQLIGDNLASPKKHLLSFCRAMRDDAPHYRWSGQLKLDRLEPPDLDVLWDGGCRGFFAGVESASQETLDRIGKAIDLEKELGLIEAALSRGFAVTTSFIIGFPWETRDDIARTTSLHADLLRRGVYHSILSTVSPLPGTDLTRAAFGSLRKRAGLSLTTLDNLPYGPATVELIESCPELFTQLDYVETKATWAEVAAHAQAAMMVTARHARETGLLPS